MTRDTIIWASPLFKAYLLDGRCFAPIARAIGEISKNDARIQLTERMEHGRPEFLCYWVSVTRHPTIPNLDDYDYSE